MSRITYKSEVEVRDVATKLREHKVTADVIHLDTGWFETDWRSNYQFSTSRFRDPAKMIADLKQQGFHISLWQYTYFTSKNELFKELVDTGYEGKNDGGALPFEDAVADKSREVNGENVSWGRRGWAGSQGYPLHWGGDAENTNSAMAAELRGGLSFGMSGFTYWSHDVGGFVERAPRDLYRRWLAWGVLTSHTRAHGAPPREPWEYDEALTEDFRRAFGLMYSLMPYIIAQAKHSSARGVPLLRI